MINVTYYPLIFWMTRKNDFCALRLLRSLISAPAHQQYFVAHQPRQRLLFGRISGLVLAERGSHEDHFEKRFFVIIQTSTTHLCDDIPQI